MEMSDLVVYHAVAVEIEGVFTHKGIKIVWCSDAFKRLGFQFAFTTHTGDSH